MPRVTLVLSVLAVLAALTQCRRTPAETPAVHPALASLCQSYIAEWRDYYPSRAFAFGDRAAAGRFERFDDVRVAAWIDFNRDILTRLAALPAELAHDDAVDARMLTRQCRLELNRWTVEDARESPGLYAGLASQAMTHLLVRDRLTTEEKAAAVEARLEGVRALCALGVQRVADGGPLELARAAPTLRATADFYESNLFALVAPWAAENRREALSQACVQTALALRELARHFEQTVLPGRTKLNALGREAYARQLPLALDRDIAPERLAALAMAEIQTVRGLMSQRARVHWRRAYPDQSPPEAFDALVGRALEDMERHREADQQSFLALFRRLVDQAETFTREKQLATVAEERTLIVDLSPPHFAGAAVGGVYVAGPFDPDADTLFYLPSIPDDASEEAKAGFYRSFNNHFNAMIIAHEMFPGHYHQFKAASANPRLVRALFANGVYVEGWGTFCELLAMENGWDGGAELTWLAHLRKRLENAVRAYASVMVHCESWDQAQLTEFAVNTGLLPPQFAENLWSRAVSSPFQIPTYFLGFHDFIALRQGERDRLGPRFLTRDFVDAVLRAGAVPTDALPPILQAAKP